MKKLIITLFSLATILFPAGAMAAGLSGDVDVCNGAADSAYCKVQEADTGGNPLFGTDGVLTKAASILAIVTGIISMFIMTIAGLRFVTSSGDPTKIESAKNAIIYSVIGLVVAISGQAIVSLVLNNL